MKHYRGVVTQKTTDKKEYKIHSQGLNEPYWDEGLHYYWKKKFKIKRKQIFKFQVRWYRTWKHNRKTKWKT